MSKRNVLLSIGLVVISILAIGLSACAPQVTAEAAGPGSGFGRSGGQTGAAAADSSTTGLATSGQTGGYGRGGMRGGNGQGSTGGGYATTPLTEAEAEALLRAVVEEQNAQALYQSVLDTFGDVYPFNVIVQSEAQHAAALIRQAEKYGISVPEATVTNFPSFDSIEAACAAGVAAEIADAALYDELLTVTSHQDIIRVYQNLQSASLNSHLPAFEACQ